MQSPMNINIDREQCVGCKLCLKVCYEDIYRWDKEADKPIPAYPEDCVMCLQCELACTAGCIVLIPTRPLMHDPF